MSVSDKLNHYFKETSRILRLTRKPKQSEYSDVAKITGLGIIVLGAIGFIIFLISQIIRRGGL
ncbi:MAG: protein translocase SEC61 complex subunit gamma [Candidatus Altiarchaeales archaeon HGW-Altiarchaeales-3]|nr:MAG: protein translocase SEC61 complex subunit gamma [Candidatus Altiarchaeales archaeon HGW-Altiarchaeales-3]